MVGGVSHSGLCKQASSQPPAKHQPEEAALKSHPPTPRVLLYSISPAAPEQMAPEAADLSGGGYVVAIHCERPCLHHVVKS